MTDKGIPMNSYYLIAYDISSPDRLRQAAKLCEQNGCRLQKSLFIANFSAAQRDTFLSCFREILKNDEDRALLLPICNACLEKMNRLGSIPDFRIPIAYLP